MSPRRAYFQGLAYAAFLFDMDGTLLDSSAVVKRVWHAWATRHGVDPAELMASIHGVRAEDTIRCFAPAGIDIAAEAESLHQAEMADVEGGCSDCWHRGIHREPRSQFLGSRDICAEVLG